MNRISPRTGLRVLAVAAIGLAAQACGTYRPQVNFSVTPKGALVSINGEPAKSGLTVRRIEFDQNERCIVQAYHEGYRPKYMTFTLEEIQDAVDARTAIRIVLQENR